MADSVTVVRRRSWLDNIIGSFVGALIGILLFIGGFPVIWIGESRTNMAAVAAESVAISPDSVRAGTDGTLVAVTGPLQGAPVGDAPYLAPGAYLHLERVAEMYAWVEDEKTERRDELGGGTTERTTYTYTKKWTSAPESGESFHDSSGHRNPTMSIDSAEYTAAAGQIGAYGVDLARMELPATEPLALTPALVSEDDRWQLADAYLFSGKGTLASPQLGDVRISYRALPAGTQVTVFGAQQGDQIGVYSTKKGDELYRALAGTRDEALKQLQIEDTITDWIFRIGALLMLWIGLALCFSPMNAVLGVIPALKQAGGCFTGLLTFIPAFVLWAVAEMVAIIANNIWLLLASVIITIGLAVFFGRRWQPQAARA